MRLTGAPIHGDVRDIRQGADKFIIIDNHAYYTTFSIEFSTDEGTIQFVDDQIGTLFEAEIASLMIDGVPASTNPLELEVQVRPFERDVFTVDDIIRARYFVWRHHSWEDGDSLIQNTVEGYIEVKTIEGTDYESRMNIIPQQIDMTVLEGTDYTTFLRMGAKDFLLENGVRAFVLDQNKIELKYNQTRLMVADEDVRLNIPGSISSLELTAKPIELLARLNNSSSNTSGDIRVQPGLIWMSATLSPMTTGGVLITPGSVTLQTGTGQEGVMATINLNGEWGTIDHGHGNTPEPANAIATYQEVQDSIYVYTYTDTALGWQVEENQTLLFAHTDIQPDLTNYVQALITHTDAESKVTEKLILNEPTDASVYISANYDNGAKIAAINLEGGWATVDQVGGVTPRPWDSIATIEDIDVYADQYTFVQDGWNWKAFQDDALIFTYTANTNIVPKLTSDEGSLIIDTAEAELFISHLSSTMQCSISMDKVAKELNLIVEDQSASPPTLSGLKLNDEFALLGSTGAIFSENGYVIVDSGTDTTAARPQNSVVQYSEFEGLVNTVDTLDLETYHDSEFTGKGTQNDILKLKFDTFSLEKWDDGTLAVSDYPLLWEELEDAIDRIHVLEKDLNCVRIVFPYKDENEDPVLVYYVTHHFMTKNVYARLEDAATGVGIYDFTYTPIDHSSVRITLNSPLENAFEVKIDKFASYSSLGPIWNVFFVDEDKTIDMLVYHVRTYGPKQVAAGVEVMFMCNLPYPQYVTNWELTLCDDQGVQTNVEALDWIVSQGAVSGTNVNYILVYIPKDLDQGNFLVDAWPDIADEYNAYLSGFTVINGLSLTPTFNPTTITYELANPVAWDYGNVTVDPIFSIPGQTYTRTIENESGMSGTAYPNINAGKTRLKFVIKSPNGVGVMTYYVILKKRPSSNMSNIYIGLDLKRDANNQLYDYNASGLDIGGVPLLYTGDYNGSALLNAITLQNLPIGVHTLNPVQVKVAFRAVNAPGTSSETTGVVASINRSDGTSVATVTQFFNASQTTRRLWTYMCDVKPGNAQVFNIVAAAGYKDGVDSLDASYTISISTSINLPSASAMFDQPVVYNFGHVWFRENWTSGSTGAIREMIFCALIGSEFTIPKPRRVPDYTKFRTLIFGGASTAGSRAANQTSYAGNPGGVQEFMNTASGTFFKYMPHYKTLELRQYIGAGGPSSGGGGCGPTGTRSYIYYVGQGAPADAANQVAFNMCVASKGVCNSEELGGFNGNYYYDSNITGISMRYQGRDFGNCGYNPQCCNCGMAPGKRYAGSGGRPSVVSVSGCSNCGSRSGGGSGNMIMTYPYGVIAPTDASGGVTLDEVSPCADTYGAEPLYGHNSNGEAFMWITYITMTNGTVYNEADVNAPPQTPWLHWNNPSAYDISVFNFKVDLEKYKYYTNIGFAFMFGTAEFFVYYNGMVFGDTQNGQVGLMITKEGTSISVIEVRDFTDNAGNEWAISRDGDIINVAVQPHFEAEYYVLKLLDTKTLNAEVSVFKEWVKPTVEGDNNIQLFGLAVTATDYYLHAITMTGDPATGDLLPFFGRALVKVGTTTWVGVDQLTPGTGETRKSIFGVFTGDGTTNTPVATFATSIEKTDATTSVTVAASTTCTAQSKVFRWTNEKFMRGSNTGRINSGYKCWTLVLTIDTKYIP